MKALSVRHISKISIPNDVSFNLDFIYVSWFVNGFDHGCHCWTWYVKSKQYESKTCHPKCNYHPPLLHKTFLWMIFLWPILCKTPKRQPHLLCDQHRIDELQVQALVGWAPQKCMVDYAHNSTNNRIWRKNVLQHIESAPIKYRISTIVVSSQYREFSTNKGAKIGS